MSGPGPYISAKEVKDSYRPRSNVMSPGLQRARAPFRNKNAILGITMFGVATGIWAYSISAVRQDTFEDLDEEARALARGPGRATTGEPTNTVIGGGSSSNIVTAGANTTSLQTGLTPLGVSAAVKDHAAEARKTKSRGLLPSSILDRNIPRFLDPAGKTLVWGAPPVDAVGKMGSSWKP